MKASGFKWTKNRLYLAAFFIPIIIMTVIAALLGLYPFGEQTILVADMNYQFVDFYAYFKSIILGNNDFTYTFSKTLGGDMAGLSAYYLQSPFNFLFLLFSNEQLPAAMLLVIILKIGFCGLTFNIFLNEIHEPKEASLIFSTGYALMSYMTAYVNSVIYFDSIILLPLIMLGIYRIVKNPKCKLLYTVTLCAAIIVNYYVAFMFCIFAVIFFVYEVVSQKQNLKAKSDYISRIASFVISSVTGALLAAFSLIPTVLSLSDVKEQASASKLELYRNFKLMALPSRLYSNSFDGNISDGLPIIFCGILTVLFVGYFFLCKKALFSKKLAALLVFGFLAASFYINTFNIVWHGFNHPIGFPYRYSFLFSFMLLYIGYEGFLTAQEELDSKKLLLLGAVFLLLSGFLWLTRGIAGSVIQLSDILWDILLVGAGITVLLLGKKRMWNINILVAALFVLQICDLSADAYNGISRYSSEKMPNYKGYVDSTEPIIEKLSKEDPAFYRTEKLYKRTHNDAMAFHYNGLSHFSSSEKSYIKQFMGKLGFRNNGNWAFYNNGSTSFADAFLGVKYILSQYGVIGKPYEKEFVHNDITVLKNPFALSLGMGAAADIEQVDMDQTNVFALQNELASAVAGEETIIYTPVAIKEIIMENVTAEEEKETGNTVYRKIDPDKEAKVTYWLQAEDSRMIYGYFTAPFLQPTPLYKNELEFGNYFERYRWDVLDIGDYKTRALIPIGFALTQDTLTVTDSYFYYEDTEVLRKWYEKVSASQVGLQKNTSSHLTGNVVMNEGAEYLLFSIPYDKAWNIKIDGNPVEAKEVFGALTAIPVQEGEHTLEMKYITAGFYPGLFISGVTLIVILCCYGYYWQKKRKARVR